MNRLVSVISSIGILIAIYLFLSNSSQTVSIINSVAKNSINGIATLQGRNPVLK